MPANTTPNTLLRRQEGTTSVVRIVELCFIPSAAAAATVVLLVTADRPTSGKNVMRRRRSPERMFVITPGKHLRSTISEPIVSLGNPLKREPRAFNVEESM
ncbi:hypothetical protein NHJ6243_005266 [Beauveria neobassiana]